MLKKAVAAAVVVAVAAALWLGPCPGAPQGVDPAVVRIGTAPVAATGEARRARAPNGPEAAVPETAAPAGRRVDVTVRVETTDGRPVAGALVEAFRTRTRADASHRRRGALVSFESPRVERSATSGADGTVVFEGVLAAGWAFAATKDGFARATTYSPARGAGIDFTYAEEPAVVVLRMAPASILRGRVVDEDRAPVAGVRLVVTPGFWVDWDGLHGVPAVSDAEGRFAVSGLPAGEARVDAARDGMPCAWTRTTVPLDGELEILVRTPGHLTGRVLDADTGAPVGGALVRATSVGFLPAEATAADDGSYRIAWCVDHPVARVVAEKAGWTMAPDGATPPAGAVVAPRVPHPSGDARRVLAIPVPPRATLRHDVLLVRGARIHGVVRGPGGPLPGAVVTATTGREPDGIWVLPAVADARGRYELVSVPAGPVLLHGSAEGHYAAGHPRAAWSQAVRSGAPPSPWRLDVAAGADVARDVVLARGIAIVGVVVTEGGAPVPGADVHALQSDVGWRRVQARAAADGTFRLEGIVPEIAAQVWASKDGWCAEDDAVRVDAGVEERVVLRMLSAFPVVGTVTDADGALPPPGTQVTSVVNVEPPATGLVVPGGRTVTVGPDGRFEIAVAAPRTSRVTFRATAPAREDGVAGPHSPEALRAVGAVDLRLRSEEVIRGRVVARGSGSPVRGALIRTGSSTGSALAHTEADGRFELHGRDPGTPAGQGRRVYATADGFGIGRAQAPAGGGDVVIEMTPVLEIRGTVRFEDGAPARGALVGAERTEAIDGSWYEFGEPGIGAFRSEAVADDEGRFRLRGLPEGLYVVLVRPSTDGTVRVRHARSAPIAAGSRDVALVVARRADGESANAFDALSDGDLGRHAMALSISQRDHAGAAAAWEALLARPLADDARADALDLYANGPLRALGRREESVRALQQAADLERVGPARRARVHLDLASVLAELERWEPASDAARIAVDASTGGDALVNAFARFRLAQARGRLGETESAREALTRLRAEVGDRRDGGWPSLGAMIDSELRR